MSLILQLDSAGQPNKWITWKTAVRHHAKKLIAWELGEVKTTIYGGTSAKTGLRSEVVTSSILCIKGKPSKKKKYKVPTLNNRELFQRDCHMCAYCGDVHGDSKLSRDHIMPTSRGGEDTWKNCVTACLSCNQKKDDKTPEEAGLQLLYVPYEPNMAEYLILKNRNILADQMQFLLGFVSDTSPLKKQLVIQQ